MRVICIKAEKYVNNEPTAPYLKLGCVYTVTEEIFMLDELWYQLLEFDEMNIFQTKFFRPITPAEEEQLQNQLTEAI